MRARRCAAVMAVLVVCGVIGHAPALAGDGRNLVRFGAAWVNPTGDLTVDGFYVEDVDPGTRLEFQGDLKLEPDSAVGFWLGYERLFTDTIGLEVGVLYSSPDVKGTLDGTLYLIDNGTNAVIEQMDVVVTEDITDIDFTPVTVGANFHLTSGSDVDLYLGPFAAWVMYGDLTIDTESVGIDDEFTWGAVVGVDVPLGARGWAFSGALRYMKASAEPEGSGPDDYPLDVDPWIVTVGAAKRF